VAWCCARALRGIVLFVGWGFFACSSREFVFSVACSNDGAEKRTKDGRYRHPPFGGSRIFFSIDRRPTTTSEDCIGLLAWLLGDRRAGGSYRCSESSS